MQTHSQEQRALTSASHCGAILRMIEASQAARANVKRARSVAPSYCRRPEPVGPDHVAVVDGYPILPGRFADLAVTGPDLLAHIDGLLADLETKLHKFPCSGLEIHLQPFVRAARGNLGYVLAELSRACDRHKYAVARRSSLLPVFEGREPRK
ncbi:hypothetical protein [Chitinimonas sp. BJB300]|uniref:hypothetical protein n=1 Tax=Chitinimonas sp. BJB300 TaxID=1559339 RepID=UPI000C113548|nr:hypothetical protein [Chitinimonas sp. BJB300]PHV10899.1 hypothetical protein CSQ89_13785 [Chitinimonas sp. BJB300]TSJ88186.1 hypothetical protein FG002_011790 [Chitinimonas sp. BJB300]